MIQTLSEKGAIILQLILSCAGRENQAASPNPSPLTIQFSGCSDLVAVL